MGTKLESAVNPLASNSKKPTTLNEWGACLKAQPVFKNLHSTYSMDRMVNVDLHSLESIKKAMLEHDHLFKQQVKELHRLYGVQRLLMNELKSKVIVRDQTRVSNASLVEQGCFNLQRYAKEPSTRRQGLEENEEEADTELTLGIGNRKYSDKGVKTKYQELPHCNVDLVFYPNSMSGQFPVTSQKKVLSDGEERSPCLKDFGENVVVSDQERKQPHWLLQSLGSHKT